MYGLGQLPGEASVDSVPSLPDVRDAIQGYLAENPRSSVYFKSIVAQDDPLREFTALNNRSNHSSVELTDHGDHHRVDVTRWIERSEREVTGSFALIRHENTNVWTAFTGESSDFFDHGLKWVIRNCGPALTEFYATSRDLESVLERFNEAMDFEYQIVVTQAVAYSHREEGEISFQTRPYPRVFRDARGGGNYIDSLSFQATAESGQELAATITRHGTTKFSGGNVELFFNYLLEDYVSFAQEKADLFRDKERSSETGETEELVIQFENPVFQSPKDNEDLIEALADLTRSSVTVYHKNPYAHISVLDFNDGSSCDVFVTDSDTVTLVPSYRGSTNFLMRISDKISKDLDEAEVELRDQSSYGVEEFVGG